MKPFGAVIFSPNCPAICPNPAWENQALTIFRLRAINFPDLSSRDRQPEVMDQPALDPARHLEALQDLARIHRFTGTLSRFWAPIHRLLKAQKRKSLTLMDVGCGDGFLVRQLFKKARQCGYELKICGCDFSKRALDFARQSADAQRIPMELYQLDITDNEIPVSVDVVTCSLFLHHFTSDEVVAILRKFDRAANQLVLVEDLRRTRLGFLLCVLGVHLFSRSSVVREDGLLSVRAAFSMREIGKLLESAKIDEYRIRRRWPERLMISWPAHGRL